MLHGICDILAWPPSILHGICYILAGPPSSLQRFATFVAMLPSMLHGICHILALQPLICMICATCWHFKGSCHVGFFRASLRFHSGFLWGFI